MIRKEFLWAQKYRPKTVNELILPESIKYTLQSFVSEGDLPNFLFHSVSGGTGKTSAAMVMAEELDMEYMMINSSQDRSIDVIRNQMTSFCSTKGFDGKRKMLILDEADQLPDLNQNALRGFIEKFSQNVSFVFTANQAQRIISPLHSRCSVIEFQFPAQERPKLAVEFSRRIYHILNEEGVDYDKKLVLFAVGHFFPDFRRCINELQRYSVGKVLSERILADHQHDGIDELIEYIKERKFNQIRKFVIEKWNGTEIELYRALYEKLWKEAHPSSMPYIILILSRYGYESEFSVDKEIHSLACITELIKLPIEFN